MSERQNTQAEGVKKARKRFKDQELKIDVLHVQMDAARKKLSDLGREYSNLVSASNIKVSDHALIRYLERVKGMDIEAIREEIIDDEIERQISILGGHGAYLNKDQSYRVRIQDNTAVTVMSELRTK